MNFFTPAEVAKNYIATGKSKVNTPIPKMIILAIPWQCPSQNRLWVNSSEPVYFRVD